MGSGKSTVAKMFSVIGIPVYDADLRAKALMEYSKPLIHAIQSLIGDESYRAEGKLNRHFISSKVFQNSTLLAALNALVHPAVLADFEKWTLQYTKESYVVKEAALMFESKSYLQLDEVIVVTSPEEIRIQRAMKHNGLSKEEVIARMKNQMREEEKIALANEEIKNDENALIIPRVLELHRKYSITK